MPITLTSVLPLPLTVDEVRMFMRDYAKNNLLLGDVQFSRDEMSKGIEFATSEFNTIAPVTAFPSESIPKSLLALGTAAWLMNSEAFLQIRNQATYGASGINPVGVDDKYRDYLSMASTMRTEWKAQALEYKKYQNAMSAFGSVNSGYRFSTRFR